MKLRSFIAAGTFACMLVTGPVCAQQQSDAIDRALSSCLASKTGETTAGQLTCAHTAATAWQRELDGTYTSLLAKLKGSPQAALRASQQRWLALRRDNDQLTRRLFRADQGTLMGVSSALAGAETLRARVMQLRLWDSMTP